MPLTLPDAPSAPGFGGSAAGLGPAPALRSGLSEDQWQALQRRGIVRVELRPARPRVLAAPFSGLLQDVFVRDGDAIKAGSAVARFDAASLEGALREARDAVNAAIDRVQGAQGASATVLDYAQQELARKADALRDAESRLAGAQLFAPVDGRIIEVFAKAGQYLKRGDSVVEIAEPGDMEIVCTVPSAWMARLGPGHLVWVYVDETAQSYEAEFLRFAGKVNSADKSIRVYARFKQPLPELVPGMSGRADFFPRSSGAAVP